MFKFFLVYMMFTFFSSAAVGVERRELGNLVIEDVPEISASVKESMRQYQNTRSALLNGWDPVTGGIIISTRFGETNQLHRVAQARGSRQQLTFFDEPIGAVAVSPAARQLLFSKDVGGSEYYQIFLMDLASGKSQLVTDGVSRNGGPVWANSGDRFVYYSTRRNNKDWDLYVSDASRPSEAKAILTEGGTWFPIEWSPDDSKILVTKYISINESYYYALDVKTGSLTQLNPSAEKISYGDATWSRNGKGVFIATDEDSEFLKLRYISLADGSQTILTKDIPWDIDEVAGATTTDFVAFTSNENGISRLYILNSETLETQRVDLPIGVIARLSFSPDGKQLGLVLNAPSSPADSYSLDLETNELIRWTHSEVGGLDTKGFVTPQLVQYETFDSVDGSPRNIPAFYYRPQGDGPFPVLIRIHGGPEGQSRPWFSWTTQYFVNESKFAVLVPNVRGSSGYGKTYLTLDNGYKREDSVKDIGMLLEWIAEQPELDADNIAVYGGSYGGYMVLASMTNFNDRIACGVDVVGISNFVTFLENTKEYRRDLRRPEYGDERDPKMREFLHRISPTTNARNITKPLFVVQGLNDPRVPVTESEQMVREIRENGQEVWYLMAKDEGHGFDKKFNRDYYLNATSMFLNRCIGGD